MQNTICTSLHKDMVEEELGYLPKTYTEEVLNYASFLMVYLGRFAVDVLNIRSFTFLSRSSSTE